LRCDITAFFTMSKSCVQLIRIKVPEIFLN
jgi:hypothetical protein